MDSIATIIENFQQFGTWTNPQGKVNKVSSNSHLEQQISNLFALVQQLL